MRTINQPRDTQQVVGVLLGVFGMLLSLGIYFGACHFLETQFGGAMLPSEKHFLGIVSAGIGTAFSAIAYSVYRD
jgi:hypothetical protein